MPCPQKNVFLAALALLAVSLALPAARLSAGGPVKTTVRVKGKRLKRAGKVFYRTRDSITHSQGRVWHGNDRLSTIGRGGSPRTLARREARFSVTPGSRRLRVDLPALGTDVALELDLANGAGELVEVQTHTDVDRKIFRSTVAARKAVNRSKLLKHADRVAIRKQIKEGKMDIRLPNGVHVRIRPQVEHGPTAKRRQMEIVIRRSLRKGESFGLRMKRLWNPLTWIRSGLQLTLDSEADVTAAPDAGEELSISAGEWVDIPSAVQFGNDGTAFEVAQGDELSASLLSAGLVMLKGPDNQTEVIGLDELRGLPEVVELAE